jgi:hypothetical protein
VLHQINPEKQKQRLADEIRKINPFCPIIGLLEEGFFNEWNGPLDTPLVELISKLHSLGMIDLAQRCYDGEFDD